MSTSNQDKNLEAWMRTPPFGREQFLVTLKTYPNDLRLGHITTKLCGYRSTFRLGRVTTKLSGYISCHRPGWETITIDGYSITHQRDGYHEFQRRCWFLPKGKTKTRHHKWHKSRLKELNKSKHIMADNRKLTQG